MANVIDNEELNKQNIGLSSEPIDIGVGSSFISPGTVAPILNAPTNQENLTPTTSINSQDLQNQSTNINPLFANLNSLIGETNNSLSSSFNDFNQKAGSPATFGDAQRSKLDDSIFSGNIEPGKALLNTSYNGPTNFDQSIFSTNVNKLNNQIDTVGDFNKLPSLLKSIDPGMTTGEARYNAQMYSKSPDYQSGLTNVRDGYGKLWDDSQKYNDNVKSLIKERQDAAYNVRNEANNYANNKQSSIYSALDNVINATNASDAKTKDNYNNIKAGNSLYNDMQNSNFQYNTYDPNNMTKNVSGTKDYQFSDFRNVSGKPYKAYNNGSYVYDSNNWLTPIGIPYDQSIMANPNDTHFFSLPSDANYIPQAGALDQMESNGLLRRGLNGGPIQSGNGSTNVQPIPGNANEMFDKYGSIMPISQGGSVSYDGNNFSWPTTQYYYHSPTPITESFNTIQDIWNPISNNATVRPGDFVNYKDGELANRQNVADASQANQLNNLLKLLNSPNNFTQQTRNIPSMSFDQSGYNNQLSNLQALVNAGKNAPAPILKSLTPQFNVKPAEYPVGTGYWDKGMQNWTMM